MTLTAQIILNNKLLTRHCFQVGKIKCEMAGSHHLSIIRSWGPIWVSLNNESLFVNLDQTQYANIKQSQPYREHLVTFVFCAGLLVMVVVVCSTLGCQRRVALKLEEKFGGAFHRV